MRIKITLNGREHFVRMFREKPTFVAERYAEHFSLQEAERVVGEMPDVPFTVNKQVCVGKEIVE